MSYWLVKSEPDCWSWQQQIDAGETFWDGVRSHQASNNLKAMKTGDNAFFYHSGNEKRVVGIVEVVREYYPDHTDPGGRFGMVDFRTVAPFAKPVTLAEIKADVRLDHLALIRQSRLSVVPIDDKAWQIICALGGVQLE